MFGKIMMTILAVLFPWVVLFAYDNPVGGVIALILQGTIIGWIPASIWALNVVYASPGKTSSAPLEDEKE